MNVTRCGTAHTRNMHICSQGKCVALHQTGCSQAPLFQVPQQQAETATSIHRRRGTASLFVTGGCMTQQPGTILFYETQQHQPNETKLPQYLQEAACQSQRQHIPIADCIDLLLEDYAHQGSSYSSWQLRLL